MRQDLAVSFRQLVRQPGLSAAAVATLSLGLAASLAVFTLLNAVLLRPLPYPEPDRVMTLGRWNPSGPGNVAHREVRFLRERVRGCGPIAAAVGAGGVTAVLQGRASHLPVQLISHGYFEALGVAPAWGRTFSIDEDAPTPPPVVVLNGRFVERQGLNGPLLIGQPIALAGVSHTIVGIVPARQMLPSDADVYRPLGNDARGSGHNLEVVCRLAAGITANMLDAELQALTADARTERLAADRAPRAYAAVSRHEWEYGSVRSSLVTLVVAVGLVLLVAAANTTGLLLVRAAGRRREIAVRTALGASPRHLARTMVGEGLVLAGLAGAIGIAIAPLLVRGLLAVAPAYYGQLAEFTVDSVVLVTTIALCAVVGFSVSLPPLLEVLRVNVRDVLQEEGARGTSGRRTIWLRQLLVGAETAVCAVLLVGALLLLRTFINLVSVPTGFDPAGIVIARMAVQGPHYESGERLVRFFEDSVARLEQSPSIEAAAVGASLPTEFTLNLPAKFPDSEDPQKIVVVNWRYVTPNYFDLLKIPLVGGRRLNDRDRMGGAPVALVNEAFAREMYGGTGKALGRRIVLHPITNDMVDPVREVVGVVANTAGWSLGDPPRPLMFVPLAQVDGSLFTRVHAFFAPRWIVRSRADFDGARRALETVMRELDPAQTFADIRTLDSLMLNSISTQRFYLVVLFTFAIVAVALAAVGLYAAYSYAVSSRTQEIGVRLALGAAPASILRQVVGQALLVGGVATGIGLIAAAAASRALQAVLYGVAPTDPLTYAVVAFTLLGTVVAATLIPAIRAARIDPLVAIRR